MTRGNGSTMTAPETPNRIREWRSRRRMSLAELGETVGLSRSEISKLENGSRRVRADHLVALAKALKVPPEDLMDRDTVRDMLGELPPPASPPGPGLPILQAKRKVPGAYAFYMPDTSFEPRVPVGGLLFVNTVLPPRAGDLAVISLTDGDPFLALVERHGDRLNALAGGDAAPIDVTSSHVRWTHRIAGVWFP
jgi:transcriptional regulator with XRE-family HTH domain